MLTGAEAARVALRLGFSPSVARLVVALLDKEEGWMARGNPFDGSLVWRHYTAHSLLVSLIFAARVMGNKGIAAWEWATIQEKVT